MLNRINLNKRKCYKRLHYPRWMDLRIHHGDDRISCKYRNDRYDHFIEEVRIDCYGYAFCQDDAVCISVVSGYIYEAVCSSCSSFYRLDVA